MVCMLTASQRSQTRLVKKESPCRIEVRMIQSITYLQHSTHTDTEPLVRSSAYSDM